MSAWLWGLVLMAAVWAAHWGAEQLAHPLKKLRRQWGLTEVAGAAFVGLAAASPEVGISTASAIRQSADIGLGTMLGSNVLAIPLVVSVAYWASRKAHLGSKDDNDDKAKGQSKGQDAEGDGDGGAGKGDESHARHRQKGLLMVGREAVIVQAIPYLVIVALVAALTLPAGWRGLQPIDGWIMLVAYLIYLAQAVLRGRGEGEDEQWSKKEIALAVGGVFALAIGAFFTVRSTENITSALGISKIIGGLFITTPMAALPELFAAWNVTRSGQVTSATTSVIGDHAVTMTVAFFPLALVSVPVQDFQLFWVNLLFVALMPAVYATLIHWGWRESDKGEHGFKLWQVLALDSVYLVYLGVTLFGVLKVL